jgi:hypothetical protein
MAGRILIGTANPSLDSNGEIAASSTLTFYENLSTTLATVYTGIDLLTPLANPLTCDASGQFPQVWAPSLTAYSVKWSRPGLASITYDNIYVSSDAGQALNYGAEVNVAAAATTDLSTSTSNRQVVLGNTTITSFGTGALLYRILRFTGTPLLTYNATTLITPTGANIQAAPGDVAIIASDEDGNWRVLSYTPYGGTLSATFSGLGVSVAVAQFATVTLKPGKWQLYASTQSRSAALNSMRGYFSTTSASSAGTTPGLSDFSAAQVAAAAVASMTMPIFEVTVTADTPYYFNVEADTNGTAFNGIFRAKRIF